MQPGAEGEQLVEAAAGFALNYFRRHPAATFEEAIAYAEHQLGIVIVGELDLQIVQAVTTALAGPEIVQATGGDPTLQQLFPSLPLGTEVKLRFLVSQKDAQGKVVWARSITVLAEIGADTFAAARYQVEQYVSAQQWTPPDPILAPAPDITFEPTLPFAAT